MIPSGSLQSFFPVAPPEGADLNVPVTIFISVLSKNSYDVKRNSLMMRIEILFLSL
jgi:hypothetical protein